MKVKELSKFQLFIIRLGIRIRYITAVYDRFQKRIIIGFGLYQLGVGCVLWCDRCSKNAKTIQRSQKRSFWWDLNRPHKILKIPNKFPVGYNGEWNSWYSRDCVTFTQDKMEYKHSII